MSAPPFVLLNGLPWIVCKSRRLTKLPAAAAGAGLPRGMVAIVLKSASGLTLTSSLPEPYR